MSIAEGHRAGPCLLTAPGAPQRVVVQQTLATLMARIGQPEVIQTDRGPCFVGSDGGQSRAVPSRTTLWLWGLGIEHRLTPPAKPQRNGVVERFQGALERNWQGEPEGLAALLAAWNYGKPSTRDRLRPYQGRAGFQLAWVWARLETVRVERQVDRDGKVSLWDRRVRLGHGMRHRRVVLTFTAARRVLVVSDERESWLLDVPLPFLTADWIWEGVSPDPTNDDDTSMI